VIDKLKVSLRKPVGVARYVRSASEPDAGEAAVAVVDDWQGRGVGRALLNRLANRALRAAAVGSLKAADAMLSGPGATRPGHEPDHPD
jgi:GNAT superfamily N-acetyltransferase